MDVAPASDPAAERIIAARRFTVADQAAFAALSGDNNPMHMDPLLARRTQAGEPVVHGIHVLLWVLDSIAAAGISLQTLRRINIEFSKFIYLDRTLSLRLKNLDSASARFVVTVDGMPAMTALLHFGARQSGGGSGRDGNDAAVVVGSGPPAALQMTQMIDRAGRLTPPVPAEAFAATFPEAARALHPRRLSGLAQTSRLVGMVCPGLHSIYAGLAVDLTDDIAMDEGIGFRTTKVNERRRRINMMVAGDGLSGQVSTFARHAPVEPPTMREVARHVQAGEFEGTTALVIGGSRGLGALTAKTIAVGGGRVIVTYARGQEDAENVRAEIQAAVGSSVCAVLAFDAMQPVAPQLLPVSEKITHLYYMASPHIFVQKPEVFISSLYARFSRVYVDAFYETCAALLRDTLSVFYPSSGSVEQRPKGMTEYSMAKAAGEMLCAEMMREMPGLRILTHRLPRILTDQTATVARVESADPIEVMLPLIRATHLGHRDGAADGAANRHDGLSKRMSR